MPDDLLQGFLQVSLEALQVIHAFIYEASGIIGAFIKIVVGIALVMPIVMVAMAISLPHGEAMVVIPSVPLVLPLTFLGFILVINRRKIGVAGLALFGIDVVGSVGRKKAAENELQAIIPTMKKWGKSLKGVVVGEFLLAGYLSFVRPEGNFIPLFLICVLIALMGAKWTRKLGIAGCAIFTVLFYMAAPSIALPAFAADMMPAPKPAGYSARACVIPETIDLSQKNMESMKITLQAGCLHGRITLPQNIADFKAFIGTPQGDPATTPMETPTQMGGDPSEWVAFECIGRHHPGRIVHWTPTEDGEIDGALDGCYAPGSPADSFRVEGRGTLTIVVTQKK